MARAARPIRRLRPSWARCERRLRDLTFNPDRYLDEPNLEEVRILLNAKSEAMTGPSRRAASGSPAGGPSGAAMRHCSPGLRRCEPNSCRRKARLLAGLRSNRIAHNREFAFVLHSERRRLRTCLRRDLARETVGTGTDPVEQIRAD